jgi:molecular chaperone GrpE
MTRPGSRRGRRQPIPAIAPPENRVHPAVLAAPSRPGGEEPRPRGMSETGTGTPPDTGAGRPQQAAPAVGEGQMYAAELQARLGERTADLQRVKAEYDNYRKRVQRDRLATRERTVADVLRGLLPVLDTIAEVRGHGDMTDGFIAVADALESHLAELGLQSFGKPGEPFDPRWHLAVYQSRSDEVDRATCAVILRPGYQAGNTLLSPAHVVVVAPPLTQEEAAPGP